MTHEITLEEYFNGFDHTQEHTESAAELLKRVNALIKYAIECGVKVAVNKKTGCIISGEKYGGFRPQDCPIGAPKSSHKIAKSVDIYDASGSLDAWITDAILVKFDLYRENPDHTAGWCHLSTHAPKSGRRTFIP